MDIALFVSAHRSATQAAAHGHELRVQADEVPLTEDVLRRLRESGL